MEKINKKTQAVGAYDISPKAKGLRDRVKGAALALVGGVVGLINGLLGGGGGSLVVPTLHTLGNLEERNAHASAILAILPLSIISGIIYGVRGNFPMKSGLQVTAGVMIGGIVGTLILKRINPRLLSIIFYGIMVYSGIKMIL